MTDPALHLYQVGKRYHPARGSWPERGVYQYRQNSHELILFFDRPSDKEVTAVEAGQASFALVTSPPVILFCYRFSPGSPPRFGATRGAGDSGGGIPWGDAPFSVHLVPEDERTEPFDLPTDDSRALLHVLLVGAHDGLIKAMRAVSLSPEFSRALHEAIRAQLAAPWDQAAFDATLAALYRRYPSSEALAAQASITCQGGR